MAGVATKIEEQIAILKSRGMEIQDEIKAKEVLLDIGYFRLGFYWFPFELDYPRKTKRTHQFREGTKLEYAIALYYFDFDLRNLILHYISRIEVNFRTKLIYYASNKYKDDPYWYINPSYVKKNFLKSDFTDILSNITKNEPIIRQDLKVHKRKNAPAWKLIEYLTFGVIIALYDNLIDGELKKDIAGIYGLSITQFSNYVNTIRRLRNYCAHGKVLFDMNLPEAVSTSGPAEVTNARKTMLSGAYLVFKYILKNISENRTNDMTSELKTVLDKVNKYPSVKRVILENSGFDENII